MKIVAHFKKGNARVSPTKVKRSVVVSIVHELYGSEVEFVTLPGRLVLSQLENAHRLLTEGNGRKLIESVVMKHMPSNFLSYLYLYDLNVLDTLISMKEKIDEFGA